MWIFKYDEGDLTLRKCWQHSTPHHFRSAGFTTIVTIVMSIVPAATAALVLTLSSQAFDWTDFLKNGEAAIFCVGLLTSSILLMAKELKHPFAHRQVFVFVGLGLVLLSMACYSGSCVAAARSNLVAPTSAPTSTVSALKISLYASAILYFITVLLYSVVAFIDEVRESLPDQLAAEARSALHSNAGMLDKFHSTAPDDKDA